MQRINRQIPLLRHATTTSAMGLNLNHDRPSSSSTTADTSRPSQPPSASSPQQHHQQHIHKPDTRVLSLFLQALIMSLVILLFFVFVGVAAIIFLHICVAGGALHRRRRRRSSVSINQRRDDNTQSGGFSPAEVRTLPKTRCLAKKKDSLCPICLDEFREGDWCRELPDCKHCFHSKCVDKWLAKVAGCPVCRTTVRLKGAAAGDGERELTGAWGSGGGDCGQLWAVFG